MQIIIPTILLTSILIFLSIIANQPAESNHARCYRERNKRRQFQLQQALLPDLQEEPAQQQHLAQQQPVQQQMADANQQDQTAAPAPVVRVA